jgi:hypothetical protein
MDMIEQRTQESISYDDILRTLRVFRGSIPKFGPTLFTQEKHPKHKPNYELTQEQALMIVTELIPKSLVYVVRELLYLEDSHKVASENKASDAVYIDVSNADILDIDEMLTCMSLIQNPLSSVEQVVSFLKANKTPSLGMGSMYLSDIHRMLMVSLSSDIGTDIWMASLCDAKILTQDGLPNDELSPTVIYKEETDIAVDLAWFSNYLDDIFAYCYERI